MTSKQNNFLLNLDKGGNPRHVGETKTFLLINVSANSLRLKFVRLKNARMSKQVFGRT